MDKIKRKNVKKNMLMVLLALIPPLVVGVYLFGYRVALVGLVAVLSCNTFEKLFNVIGQKVETIDDYSATVTGTILTCLLPPNIPFWMVVIGSFVSIVVGKKLFGGLGRNFVNPAALGIVFLNTAYPIAMSTFSNTNISTNVSEGEIFTPLQLWITGNTEGIPSYVEMFLGFESGTIGGISIVAILASCMFLLWKKLISPLTTIVYLVTVACLFLLMKEDPIFHLMTGDVFFVSVFLLNDPETLPKKLIGRVLFALGAGGLTVIFRFSGAYLDGAVLSVLIMNLCTPLINKINFKEVGADEI